MNHVTERKSMGPEPTAQIGDENTRLVLFQNADDLVFGEPATLHLWSSRLGQSLSQTGLAVGGNVTPTRTLCGHGFAQQTAPRFSGAQVIDLVVFFGCGGRI